MTSYLPMRNTFEFLSVWRLLDSPDSKPLEFEGIRNVAGRYSGAIKAHPALAQQNQGGNQ